MIEEALERYRAHCNTPSPDHLAQQELIPRFERLARVGPSAFERTLLENHFTASVLITSHEMDSVLLTLHRKLGLWLQLGGHADGDADLAAVALKEGQEESGLTDIRLFPSFDIFDLDIHWIPERRNEPGHWHYDVRYLGVADRKAPIAVSEESSALKWIPLSDAYGLTNERSMHRQFDKLAWVRDGGKQ